MANRKSIFSFISMIIFTTFLISVNSQQTEVSFRIARFTPGDSRITLQGTASINNGILALINRRNPRWNTGRALYSRPVRIWDRTTGNTASFVTSFSLVVVNIPSVTPADGFIFFLSPNSQIPTNSSGGKLGVVNPREHYNNFVGVELDTYVNGWDPSFPHIGINVNSLGSLQTVRWNRISGSLVQVSIVYDSPSNTLSVLVTYPNGQVSTVSQVIDLKAVLPETVRIGLSATTSGFRQYTDIRSWSFTSTFGRNNDHLAIIAEQK